MVVIIIMMSVMIVAGIFLIKSGGKPKKEQDAQQSKMYLRLYGVLSRSFVTKMYIHKIYTRLANLSIYKRDELCILSVQYFVFAWGCSIALILFGFFMFNDFLTTLICILFAMLVNTTLVDKQIDGLYLKVLKELSRSLGSIRQEYMKLGSVVEAINEAETGNLLKKPMDEIYSILVSSNQEMRLQEFYESTPFRTIQTLAGICYNINNQGDEIDNYGQSNFIQALTIMSSDVNAEIQKLTMQKRKFGIIEYLPFAPILGIGVIEKYFTWTMPGTALIYHGPMGYILRTITVFVSIICYAVVSRINMSIPVKEDDRGDSILALLKNKKVSRVINNIIPKSKKAVMLKKELKDSISRMSLEHLYTKKLIAGIGVSIFAILVFISAMTLGADFVENSTQQLSLVATKEMDAYTADSVRAMDGIYLNADYMSPEEALLLVKGHMPGLSDLQALDQVKRLEDKKKTLSNAYFKWWFVLIAYACGVVAWFCPNLGIKLRKVLIQNEAEDDFLQLQTLVSILMNTQLDTLDILHQFCQHSRVHKDMLLYCYHSYSSNPEMELARLQAKTPIIEFKRFIGKLKLTISDLSLREAFSDLIIEREHILRIREINIDATINRKRSLCGLLSLVPIGAMVLGELIIPLGILGYREFMGALTMFKGG